MIKVTTSSGGLEQFIARLKAFDKAELERQIAQAIIEEIKRDTGLSVDVDGRPFVPYTPGYAKKRQKEGLSTTPNLEVTGWMLESLTVTKTGIGTQISDSDNPGKVEGNQRLRKFIGLSQKSRSRMLDIVRQFIGNIIK